MIVCFCLQKNDRDIRRELSRDGVNEVLCRHANKCGSCMQSIREIHDELGGSKKNGLRKLSFKHRETGS